MVKERLERELNSIIKETVSRLCTLLPRSWFGKSNEDGYLVGSRGSVGSPLWHSLPV
ncbi:hypothetical protein [Butyrivibrio sp. FCS014]|uniref:hypothetical protein n=1 Tax=Butyrivibrio sp. FCS014 TaxID=1408304 RepID=UPI003FA45AC5